MVIKRNISFYIQKTYNGTDDAECQILMRAVLSQILINKCLYV